MTTDYSKIGKSGYRKSQSARDARFRRLREEYNSKPNRCALCKAVIPYEKKSNTYCGRSCSARRNNSTRDNSSRRVSKECSTCGRPGSIDHRWGRSECFDCVPKKNGSHTRSEDCRSAQSLRKYLLRTREYVCLSCNLSEWLGNPIPLEVDHVDGNSSNNAESNLRLLCPTCHSLTPTYKAKNKGNGRFKRMNRYNNGESY